MISKKTKSSKKVAPQLQNQPSHIKPGPSGQQIHKQSLRNENLKPIAKAIPRKTPAQPPKQSYSVIAQRPAGAQPKGPSHSAALQQHNNHSKKHPLAAKPASRPSQPGLIGSRNKLPNNAFKPNSVNLPSPKVEGSARTAANHQYREAEPPGRQENTAKIVNVAEHSQQHAVAAPNIPRFNVTYSQTNRGSTVEQSKHTTVASAQLPFHRRSSTSSNHVRQRPSVPDRYQRHLLESEEDNHAKNDYRQRKNPTGKHNAIQFLQHS